MMVSWSQWLISGVESIETEKYRDFEISSFMKPITCSPIIAINSSQIVFDQYDVTASAIAISSTCIVYIRFLCYSKN